MRVKLLSAFLFPAIVLLLVSGCAPETSFSETQELALPIDGIRIIEIKSGNGDVGIRGVAQLSEIKVTAEVEIRGKDSKRIRETLENQLVLTLEKRSNTAVFNGYFKNAVFPLSLFLKQYRKVHINIDVPAHLEAAVTDEDGNLYISGMRNDVSVQDDAGKIVLENIAGRLSIEDLAGDIILDAVKGSVEIDDKGGEVELKNSSGSIYIVDTTDGIRLSSCSGPVRIRDAGGKIIIENHTGEIQIRARGRGDVTLKNIDGDVIQNY